jgi:asparagine synthase (glutamine-hydrolysing)
MCSFLFSSKITDDNIEDLNRYLKLRGPDHTEKLEFNKCLFIHNLLSITGDFTPQPIISGDIVAIYNGEIYNYEEFGDYTSDGGCLIPLYKKYGKDFIKKLDGEFAICIIDFKKKIIIVSSDLFKTKPFFIGFNGKHVGVSTYKTPLEMMGYNVMTPDANVIYTISLKDGKIKEQDVIYNFDLNQHKTTYDDWIAAFKTSIKKRLRNTNKKIFIGLSGGYDSGLIFNELIENKHSFYSYSLIGTENEDIIDKRLNLKSNNCISMKIPKNNGDYIFSNMLIKKNTEPFNYTIPNDKIKLVDDGGSNNFATICRKAKKNNCKICLSGTGADEIISDYGYNGLKFFPHSNFGGKFPSDLDTIFPWPSFYNSTLESYIAKEEYVGGSFGIEMRYPFLDKNVVQEFLWLHQDLKNKEYKAPIHYYFKQINFPFEEKIKRGF